MALFLDRMSNPLAGPINFLFGTKIELGETCRNVRANKRLITSEFMKHIQMRKEGKTQSKMNGHDLLSCFLESPDMFSDLNIS